MVSLFVRSVCRVIIGRRGQIRGSGGTISVRTVELRGGCFVVGALTVDAGATLTWRNGKIMNGHSLTVRTGATMIMRVSPCKSCYRDENVVLSCAAFRRSPAVTHSGPLPRWRG